MLTCSSPDVNKNAHREARRHLGGIPAGLIRISIARHPLQVQESKSNTVDGKTVEAEKEDRRGDRNGRHGGATTEDMEEREEQE